MADWLNESLNNSGTIVTANRRLARSLIAQFNLLQQQSGRSAWRSPRIYSWSNWCSELIASAQDQESIPTHINAQQSQWLWERCLRKEITHESVDISNLVRLSRDIWQRLADWQISIKSVAAAVQSADQRIFAAAAGRYLGILERENWLDDAATSAFLLRLIKDSKLPVAGVFTFAGFGRQRPVQVAIQSAIVNAGGSVELTPRVERCEQLSLHAYDSTDSELRAAGAWARSRIEADPDRRVAIVSSDLDSDAAGIARRVREGFTPGWQYGPPSQHDALNVSYGRRLADYPVISIALLSLRWLHRELTGSEVGVLLRSPLLASSDLAGRSRLELRLRQLPDRRWSPAMITAALRGKGSGDDDDDDGHEWLAAVAKMTKRRRELPKSASPAEWAMFMDESLRQLQWPGQGTLASADYQLVNRWRELLNELARLDLVSARMTFSVALSRLENSAGETIFQAESTSARVQLLGPLEAAGTEFDGLWILGLHSASWPPAAAPSALVSRKLQEKFDLPDCTPANTTRHVRALLTRLTASADEVQCSYARMHEDNEQTPSSLLLELQPAFGDSWPDPGWHAASLIGRCTLTRVSDRVPPVKSTEKLSGGAAVVQQQLDEPLTAFIRGRLHARPLYSQAVGIPPPMRGNLIHDALYHLYHDLPQRSAIANWGGDDLRGRIAAAVEFAFARHERQLDDVLQQLFALERQRVGNLLQEFIAIDAARDNFKIASVEGELEFVADKLRLALRFDRIDALQDGQIAILDYKTGASKRLWDRDKEPLEIQLFVYAMATEANVAALALVNIDSREITFDGAGQGYSDVETWPQDVAAIQQKIMTACAAIQAGDVSINITHGAQHARSLSVLSRYGELRLGDE
jgi:probable DNA repair protein